MVNPPQLDISSFDGCPRGEPNQWRASGELLNNSPTTATYEVVVGFYEDEVRLDERTTWVRDLRPGERGRLDHGWWIEGGDRVTSCEILVINRFG